MTRATRAASIALMILAACATPARRVALEPTAPTPQASTGRLEMPSCAHDDTIGMQIPDYAGNPANDDAPPVTAYANPQQALTAELARIAPLLSANRFTQTYASNTASFAGESRQQFAFMTDGKPGILVDLEGGRTWRVVRTASCTAVINQYR